MIAHNNSSRRARFPKGTIKRIVDSDDVTWRNEFPRRPIDGLGKFRSYLCEGRVPLKEPYWERDEVIVCMVLAFCIGNTIIMAVYRLTA